MAAQYLIKKNTAGAIFWVGLTPQTPDGTYKAAPTLAAGDVKLSGDGGSFNNLATLPTVTPAAGKAVKVSLSQAETNYDNIVIVFSDAAGAEWNDLLIAIETVDAQLADIYSRLGAPAGASLAADIATRASQTSVDTLDDYVDTEVAAIKAKTDGLTYNVAGEVDVNVRSWKNATAPAMTGDAFARLGAPAGASVSADVAAAKVDTAAIKVTTDKFVFTTANQVDAQVKSMAANVITAAATAADFGTEIAAAVWDALVTGITTAGSIGKRLVDDITGDIYARLGAPAGASTAADIAAVKAVLPAALVGGRMDSSVGAMAADVLTAAATAADFGTEIATAVWNRLTSALTTVGSIGKLLVDNIDATISSRSSHSAADVWAVATRLLSAGTNIVLAKGVGVTGFNDLSAAQVNAEADTALADYDAPTHAELTSELATADDAVLAQVALVKAKTDNLPGDPADASDIASAFGTVNTTLATIAGYLDTEIAAIKAKTDNLPGDPADQSLIIAATDAIAAEIAALENISVADILAGVVEPSFSLKSVLQILVAAAGSKVSGAAGATNVFRDPNDTRDVVTATVDADGNRTAVAYDVTG